MIRINIPRFLTACFCPAQTIWTVPTAAAVDFRVTRAIYQYAKCYPKKIPTGIMSINSPAR
jgi:hypothetical protein